MKLEPPFQANNLQMLSLKIVKGQYGDPGAKYSSEIKGLLAQLLKVDPKKRIGITDILSSFGITQDHPLIKPRVNKYLSGEELRSEFSHTILHNQRINVNQDRLKEKFNDLKVVSNENVAKKPDPPKVAAPAPVQVQQQAKPPAANVQPQQRGSEAVIARVEVKPQQPAMQKAPSNPYLPSQAELKPKTPQPDNSKAGYQPNSANYPSRPPAPGQPYNQFAPAKPAPPQPQKPSNAVNPAPAFGGQGVAIGGYQNPMVPPQQKLQSRPQSEQENNQRQKFEEEKALYKRHLEEMKQQKMKVIEEDAQRRRMLQKEEEERKRKRQKEMEEEERKKRRVKEEAEEEARKKRQREEEAKEREKEEKKQRRDEERVNMRMDIAKKRKEGGASPVSGGDVVMKNYPSAFEDERRERPGSRGKAVPSSPKKKPESHLFEERPSSRGKAPQGNPVMPPSRIAAQPQVVSSNQSAVSKTPKSDVTDATRNKPQNVVSVGMQRGDLSVISGITENREADPTTLFEYTKEENEFKFDIDDIMLEKNKKEDKVTSYFNQPVGKRTGGFNDFDDDIIDINKASNEINERLFGIGGSSLEKDDSKQKKLRPEVTNVDFITVGC
jgi:hypothetical protein